MRIKGSIGLSASASPSSTSTTICAIALEINGVCIPTSDPTSSFLWWDCLNCNATEVTYISNDSASLTSCADFEVSHMIERRGKRSLWRGVRRVARDWRWVTELGLVLSDPNPLGHQIELTQTHLMQPSLQVCVKITPPKSNQSKGGHLSEPDSCSQGPLSWFVLFFLLFSCIFYLPSTLPFFPPCPSLLLSLISFDRGPLLLILSVLCHYQQISPHNLQISQPINVNAWDPIHAHECMV